MRVVDAHPAENRKGLDEVFVVFRKRQIVKLVYQLYNADYLTAGIFYGHAQDGFVLESLPLVHARIEPWVIVRVHHIDSLEIKAGQLFGADNGGIAYVPHP